MFAFFVVGLLCLTGGIIAGLFISEAIDRSVDKKMAARCPDCGLLNCICCSDETELMRLKRYPVLGENCN